MTRVDDTDGSFDDAEYDEEIKRLVDKTYGIVTQRLVDSGVLIGRWTSQYPNGTVVIWEFHDDGTCKDWVDGDKERKRPVDKWKVVGEGWLSVSREQRGVWYEDLWRIYVCDSNRFILVNEDASIIVEHRRVVAAP
jgi:hypothetical protein